MSVQKLRPKKTLYIALDGYDLSWTADEVEQVKYMWQEGKDIREIARAVRGTSSSYRVVEVAVLVMDLAMKSEIEPRSNGVFSP